jgi:hypothetical protein
MALDAWVPLFAKLVWPAVIVGVGTVYHAEAGRLVGNFNNAIEAGRSVKVVDLFEIGAGTPIGEVVEATAKDVGKEIDLSVNAIGGYDAFVDKGSGQFLYELQERLRQSPGQTIEVLGLRDGYRYSTKLLHSYVESLGIRYVVFQEGDRFVGWIDAGLFNSQLPPPERDEQWDYSQLLGALVGRHEQFVPAETSALDVLRIMEQEKLESIAVVENGAFKSMVSREAILAKLLTATILKGGQET